ncbi:OmpA family protein [Agaribacter marinus]|uniref:OmpA-like domain-containing protein n=1 Tax=Agaribacter marinus TaxID=1431249 RepID=A0AA37WJ29_9ALTE|nr:OmpA family protein [Agaribacter marinus]GLR71838.1 hypothetical protein GCM10007852_27460 [Agaribacter marinus]
MSDIQTRAKEDLEKLRKVLLQEPLTKQQAEMQRNARQMVKDVVSEAINDREKQDNSVSQVLLPVVEHSIQKSFKQQRKELIDYIFPLVGDLVRKYVAASLREFIEKTNDIIESSLSFRGLKWRYQAWRSGMSYAKYVIAQTHIYKIHQVLLIHKETGILLHSASANSVDNENSELISSMLTAINDFVADSFSTHSGGSEQELAEIKTKEFSLYLKQGPSALLVASVTGTISPSAKHQLQTSLEYIHKMYVDELHKFNGDTSTFSVVESTLQACLLEEQKSSQQKNTWLAIILLGAAGLFLGWLSFLYWQASNIVTTFENGLTGQNGITLTHAEISDIRNVEVTVMRDPSAISIEDWMGNQSIDKNRVKVNEISVISLSNDVVTQKINDVLRQFPQIMYAKGRLSIQHGMESQLHTGDVILLESMLRNIPGVDSDKLLGDISHIQNIASTNSIDTNAIQHLLGKLIGEISNIRIEFAVNQSDIPQFEAEKIKIISEKFNKIQIVAEQLNKKALLLVLGTSDTQGTQDRNQMLSIERAENVKNRLVQHGVNASFLQTVAIGQVETNGLNSNARKAIFAIMY